MATPLRRTLVVVLSLLGGVLALPGHASAHTELDFTLPTDEASVGEPVSEITIGFTEPVTLVGNGFEVLDPQGNLIEPFAVTDDDQVFRLQLEPPLGGGVVGVAYEVTSLDGHVVEGAFSFTVSVPAPTTTTTPTATTAPTTVAPVPTPATTAAVTSPPTPAPTISTVPVSADSTTTTLGEGDDGDDSGSAWIYLLLAGGAVIAAGAFLLFRKSSTGGA